MGLQHYTQDMSRIPLKYHINVLFYTTYTHPMLICRGRTDGRKIFTQYSGISSYSQGSTYIGKDPLPEIVFAQSAIGTKINTRLQPALCYLSLISISSRSPLQLALLLRPLLWRLLLLLGGALRLQMRHWPWVWLGWLLLPLVLLQPLLRNLILMMTSTEMVMKVVLSLVILPSHINLSTILPFTSPATMLLLRPSYPFLFAGYLP
jgi:hypothetical protein